MFESKSNLNRVEYLDCFDILLKDLSIVIMPLGNFDIKNVVIKLFDLIKILVKHLLEILQRGSPFFTFSTTENWHAAVSSTQCELELTFADLFQVLAPLDESFVFSKDFIFRDVVALVARMILDHVLRFCADFLPHFAALDAFV